MNILLKKCPGGVDQNIISGSENCELGWIL